ncbi:hypothetical protein AMK59_2383 [Oryctes borbonicus]|uniref:Uncharacterized protein n=1 Tax=Oryctes borbonicus TaxID=1629725 RepID=A0A0T6BCF6_9SCAR|nr:hypothetical protein AMK59_2383 [Oryctes borbonicus]
MSTPGYSETYKPNSDTNGTRYCKYHVEYSEDLVYPRIDRPPQNCKAIIPDYYWRNYIPNHIPDDALEGPDGKYIGQALFRESLLPACIDPCLNRVIAVRARRRFITDNIKILCAPYSHKFYWEDVDFSCKGGSDYSYLNNIVKGGFEDGCNLYIGKAYHKGEWKIGKVYPKEKRGLIGLRLWKDGGERDGVFAFSILKYDPLK